RNTRRDSGSLHRRGGTPAHRASDSRRNAQASRLARRERQIDRNDTNEGSGDFTGPFVVLTWKRVVDDLAPPGRERTFPTSGLQYPVSSPCSCAGGMMGKTYTGMMGETGSRGDFVSC